MSAGADSDSRMHVATLTNFGEVFVSPSLEVGSESCMEQNFHEVDDEISLV
jgi:hypothetical protein